MGLVHTQQDVLWFDVSVDDLTLSVEVGQALQNLSQNLFGDRPGQCRTPTAQQ